MNHVYIPAKIGMRASEIDTPALVIDLDLLEKNIGILADFCQHQHIDLRPHAKTHKSVDVAMLQIKHGAVGICCQKVSEAEVFVSGGISDVFITNEIIGKTKISRLINLAREARVSVCVDNETNIRELGEAARRAGIHLSTFVEVDIGGGRCGVQPGSSSIDMVRSVLATPNLSFGGLQVYHGRAQHIKTFRDRKDAINESLQKVSYSLNLLKKAGIDCPSVSGGGTGSYLFETEGKIYTELQCGSYVFMDVDYSSILMDETNHLDTFNHSLYVLTSVMSKPTPRMAVCDAGLKAHSIDSGLPSVKDRSSLVYQQPSDEHGILVDTEDSLSLGDKLYLIPGHCDPTVNLHDWYIGVRDGHVESIWPVSARGMIF